MITRSSRVVTRDFSTGLVRYKNLPRPSQQYMSDMGEQPIPLTEKDIATKELADIELPQATLDEKAQIKKAMKKRSLRMTFWQLFLVTVLSSMTLNIMREKNLKEELDDNFDKKFKVLKKLKTDAEEGRITYEEAKDALRSWNERFVEVFELSPVEVKGVEGLDKKDLKVAFKKIKGIEYEDGDDGVNYNSNNAKMTSEKLNKFL